MKRGGSISGAVSLVMIFCVLCLAVFTTLTVSTARREQKLSRMTAQRTEEFYAADTKATEIARQVFSGALPETVVFEAGEDGAQAAKYEVAVNEAQTLEIVLIQENGKWRVEQWKTVYTGDWTPDDSIHVWDGF